MRFPIIRTINPLPACGPHFTIATVLHSGASARAAGHARHCYCDFFCSFRLIDLSQVRFFSVFLIVSCQTQIGIEINLFFTSVFVRIGLHIYKNYTFLNTYYLQVPTTVSSGISSEKAQCTMVIWLRAGRIQRQGGSAIITFVIRKRTNFRHRFQCHS